MYETKKSPKSTLLAAWNEGNFDEEYWREGSYHEPNNVRWMMMVGIWVKMVLMRDLVFKIPLVFSFTIQEMPKCHQATKSRSPNPSTFLLPHYLVFYQLSLTPSCLYITPPPQFQLRIVTHVRVFILKFSSFYPFCFQPSYVKYSANGVYFGLLSLTPSPRADFERFLFKTFYPPPPDWTSTRSHRWPWWEPRETRAFCSSFWEGPTSKLRKPEWGGEGGG